MALNHSGAKVVTPYTTAQLPGGIVPVISATMSLTAGGVSTCAVTTNVSAGRNTSVEVLDMLNEQIATRIGNRQSLLFMPRGSPDSTVTISDGQGGVINFRGYFSNPSYSNSPGSMGTTYSVVHESAILSAYRGYIYATDPSMRQLVTAGSMWNTISAGPDVLDNFKQVLALIVQRWISHYGAMTPGEQKTFFLAQHAENEKIRPILNKVLDASSVRFKTLRRNDSNAKLIHDISEWISNNVILQPGRSFFENLSTLEQAFQCIMIPLFNAGEIAKFIPQRSVMEDATSLYIPAVDVQYSGGDRKMLPIVNVVVMSNLGNSLRRAVQTPAVNQPKFGIAVWPENDISGGDVLRNEGPPWLLEGDYGTAVDPTQSAVVSEGLSIATFSEQRIKANTAIAKFDSATLFPIMKEWARNLYSFAALEGSTASLTIPLSVKMVPGSRYNVSDLSGRPLFSGFLSQVVHTTALTPKPSGNTFLSFSHIEAGTFKLPRS